MRCLFAVFALFAGCHDGTPSRSPVHRKPIRQALDFGWSPHRLKGPRMKRHLNTLFVMTEGSYLSKEGQAVRVKVEKETRIRVPLINLDGIVCFGRVSCSPMLLGACAEAGVRV